MKELYLGFDLSTQQLKIVSIYSDLSYHSKYSIDFDEFASKYGTDKGVIKNIKTGEALTPVSLWIDAIETLFDRMKNDDFPFENVKSISGSCQQHGTVFYSRFANDLLKDLEGEGWSEQLTSAFSFKNASNWQDRSTIDELNSFEKALGSASKLCEKTGSRAHYRFSGLQMRKRFIDKEKEKECLETNKIGLISSFLNSLLCGEVTGIEVGEACGTNLFDLKNEDWNDELLSLVAGKNSIVDNVSKVEEKKYSSKVREMLGPVVKSNEGKKIAHYLVQNYNFNPECVIWPITGDNLATIMSLPLDKDDLLVSMGTSTTVLLVTDKYIPSVNYHMFKHPVCPSLYMGMLCYSNGSLARENVRDKINKKYNCKGWQKFNEILNDAEELENIGIYFPLGEIIPNAKPQIKRFDKDLNEISVPIEEDVNLIIESQALSCRMRVCPLLSNGEKDFDAIKSIKNTIGNGNGNGCHGEKIVVDGVEFPIEEFGVRPKRVFYVGGGSNNEVMVKKFDKILNGTIGGYRIEITDACALGGCFRALWGSTETTLGYEKWLNEKFDWDDNVDEIQWSSIEEQRTAIWRSYSSKVGLLSLAEGKLDK